MRIKKNKENAYQKNHQRFFQKEGEVNIIKFKREATKRKKESTSVESFGNSNKKNEKLSYGWLISE